MGRQRGLGLFLSSVVERTHFFFLFSVEARLGFVEFNREFQILGFARCGLWGK
jgi:hypothetical protein